MTVKEIISTHARICNLIGRRRLAQAFAAISTLQKELREWWAINRLEELETLYGRMLPYQLGDVAVPDQESLYHRLMVDTYDLADRMREQLLSLNSSQYEYLQKRFRPTLAIDIAETQEQMERNYAKLSLDTIITTTNGSSDAHSEIEQLMLRLFNGLWLSDNFDDSDARALDTFIESPIVTTGPKSIAISAITLNLLRKFDERRLSWLITQAATPEAEVRQRVLTAIILTLGRYGSRFEAYDNLRTQLQLLADNPDTADEIESVLLQLIRTSETASITQHIQEEILPEMMRISPMIRDKMEQLDADKSEDKEAVNPDWQELFDEHQISDKIQEFGELQMVGADVYVSTFAALKNFPFFNDTLNWFMPFDQNHSHVKGLFGEGTSLLSIIMGSAMLCNSDKYSFCLSLRQMPEMQRKMMVESMKAETEQMNEMMSESKQLTANAGVKSIANGYIQDIYRFYTLFPKHGDFANPLDEVLEIYRLPVFSILFPHYQERRRIAEYYFSKKRWHEAYDLFDDLGATLEQEPEVYEKQGYSAQKMGMYDKAIGFYLLADSLKPDRVWTMQRMAFCYRKLGRLDEALACYERIAALQPDNIKTMQQIAAVHIEKGDYEQAVALFYKIDYIAPETPNIARMLAWSAFLAGQLEQADRLYVKLLKKSPQMVDYLNAGHAAWATGDIKRAQSNYRQALTAAISTAEFIKLYDNDLPYLLKNGIDEAKTDWMLDAVLSNITL